MIGGVSVMTYQKKLSYLTSLKTYKELPDETLIGTIKEFEINIEIKHSQAIEFILKEWKIFSTVNLDVSCLEPGEIYFFRKAVTCVGPQLNFITILTAQLLVWIF